MNQPTYSVKLPYRVYCNLPECGKPTNLVFTKYLDNVPCRFCSPQHAAIGQSRWNEKKEKDIRMGVPPKEDTEEYTGGYVPGEGAEDNG